MSDKLAELTEIVKLRYETGAYGNTHLRIAPDVMVEMRKHAAPQPMPDTLPNGVLGDLMAIPIRIDEGMPADEWRLVDNSTGEDIRMGVVGQRGCDCAEYVCAGECCGVGNCTCSTTEE